MKNEIIIALISGVVGGAITLLTSLIIEFYKQKRKDKLEARKERKTVFENRPEMSIIDYKDYISRTGYGIKQKCDIELFVAHIENVAISGDKKNDIVNAHYREEDFDKKDW